MFVLSLFGLFCPLFVCLGGLLLTYFFYNLFKWLLEFGLFNPPYLLDVITSVIVGKSDDIKSEEVSLLSRLNNL